MIVWTDGEAASEKGSLAFTSTMQIEVEHVDEFLRALRPIFDMLTERPGCEFAYLVRENRAPATFTLFERWADRDTFLAFTRTEPWRAYMAATEPLYAQPRVVTTMRVLAMKPPVAP